MIRRLCALALVAIAARAFADEEPRWKSVFVHFSLSDDGSLHISDQLDVDVKPEIHVIERRYWTDAEQHVTFDGVTRVNPETGEETALTRGSLDAPDRFDSPLPGKVAWTVAPGSFRYVVETTISDAVIPGWSLARGPLTYDPHSLSDPPTRLRELLPIWRAALRKPRTLYLVDVQYEMPPPSAEGTDIQLRLTWGDQWEPERTITGDTIAEKIDYDTYNSTRWRVVHLFDYIGRGTPAAVDVRRHAIRAGAVAGFPAVCLLLWLLFVVREYLRRGGSMSGEEVDVVTTVFSEPPEVIAARWSGKAKRPRIEPFLRRLEQQRKVALGVDDVEDKHAHHRRHVTLRLLVAREELTDYERAGIDALIPTGWETSSDQIRQRKDVDAAAELEKKLAAIAVESNGPKGVPWYSRVTSFAIFAFGVYLLVLEVARNGREPAVLAAGLIGSSMIRNIWPDSPARTWIRNSLWCSLLLLIPIALATALVLCVHLVTNVPPGTYASAGIALVMLATIKAILAATATRTAPDALRRYAELTRARRWLRAELRSSTPRLRPDAAPWLEALGLHRKGTPPPADEGWGEALER